MVVNALVKQTHLPTPRADLTQTGNQQGCVMSSSMDLLVSDDFWGTGHASQPTHGSPWTTGPGCTPVRDTGLPPTAAAGQGAARTPGGPPEVLEPRHWSLSSRPLLTARSVSLPFGVSLIH